MSLLRRGDLLGGINRQAPLLSEEAIQRFDGNQFTRQGARGNPLLSALRKIASNVVRREIVEGREAFLLNEIFKML